MNDRALRNAALFAVQRLWHRHGDAVPWSAISDGFRYEGERIPFFSTFEGVYKPRQLQVGALSVRSTRALQFDGEPLDVPDAPEVRPDRELLTHRWERAREG